MVVVVVVVVVGGFFIVAMVVVWEFVWLLQGCCEVAVGVL